jgi:hypothetical protein
MNDPISGPINPFKDNKRQWIGVKDPLVDVIINEPKPNA